MNVFPSKGLEYQIIYMIDSICSIIIDFKFSSRSVVPDTFIDLINDILKKVKINFISEFEDILETKLDNEEEEITKLSLTYFAFIRKLSNNLLFFLETSEHTTFSNETLFSLRNLIKKFSRNTFELALIPSWEYNYKIYAYKDLYNKLLKDFGLNYEYENKYPSWFIFLQYPNIEANNILQNCVFSHEIAHFKDFSEDISVKLLEQIKIAEDEFEREMNILLKREIPHLIKEDQGSQLTIEELIGKEEIKHQLYQEVTNVINCWLNEIVADLLAIRTFGPAYLYSLILTSIHLGVIDLYTETHPSSSWRIKYCLDELRAIGFKNSSQDSKIEKYLDSWDAFLKENHKEPNSPSLKISYISLFNCFTEIIEPIRRQSNFFTFNSKNYDNEKEKIKELFFKCIPPSSSWKDDQYYYFNNLFILNAAWEIYLTDKDKFFENFDIKDINDEVKAIDILNKLTLKAIESSDILRLWKEKV